MLRRRFVNVIELANEPELEPELAPLVVVDDIILSPASALPVLELVTQLAIELAITFPVVEGGFFVHVEQ